MIYDFPDIKAPIRQGDIFVGIPRLEISLERFLVINEDNKQEIVSWDEIIENGEPVPIITIAKPVTAIVITQDCDALRAPDITLCEIKKFVDVEGKCQTTKRIEGWVNIITQQARVNQKWFYLPPESKLGFETRMGVDFLVTLRVPRHDIENLRHFRKGRLNDIADSHFRERISEFFRRYPYDEWYPLNREEMDYYIKKHPGVKPFGWQLVSNLPK